MDSGKAKLSAALEFEWDQGNLNKNRLKHLVEAKECEDIFYHDPLVSQDIFHSHSETRMRALGQTSKGRLLFVAFTVRKNKIRVISARVQNKKEKLTYQKEVKPDDK